MRKVTTTVAAALVALSFAACNKTNSSVTPEEGSASGSYASLTVSTNALPSLKADPDQEEEAGRGAESKIASMDLIGNITKSFTLATAENFDAPGTFWQDATDHTTYRTAPWEVSVANNQNVALVLNKGGIDLPGAATFDVETYGSHATAIEDIAALSSDDKFTMTSSSKTIDILPNIDKTKASKLDGTKNDNVFSFDIERIVAQGFMSKGAGLAEGTSDGSGKVDLNDLTYSVMNGAAKTFIMRNNAGERQMGGDNQYKGFKSAIDDYKFADAKAGTNVDENLIRIGRLAKKLGKTTNADLGGYKAIKVNDNAYTTGGGETNRGIYFLENSAAETLDATNKKLGYARLATAKVYTTFTPTVVMTLKEGAVATFKEDTGSGVWYKVTTKEDKSDPNNIKTTTTFTERTIATAAPYAKSEKTEGNVTTTVEWKEGRAIYKKEDLVKNTNPTPGKTFYVGSTTLAIYDSIEAALAGHANTQVKTYKDGRCGYYALWNRTPNVNVVNGEARRNNIYSLSITGFSSRGFNFDPLDPNDPNLPQPDPNDKDNDHDPDHHTTDIEPAKSYMRVDAKVLQWNHVSRGVVLGF